MLRGPVTDNETLETKFVLEDVVLKVGVLASVAVVDLVVSAHDRAGAGANCIGEGPYVKLVLVVVSKILKDASLLHLTRVTSSMFEEMASLTLGPPWRKCSCSLPM